MPPFKYPEELYEIVSAMYDIIKERLANDESMRFLLYEYGGCNNEYKQFLSEIERRTRYKSSDFGSDLEDLIEDERRHGENYGNSERLRQLSQMKPLITISPSMTIYYQDMADGNAWQQTTTPEESLKRYGQMLNEYNNDKQEIPSSNDSLKK